MKTKLRVLILLLLALPVSCFADDSVGGAVPRFMGEGPSIISLPLDASPFTGEAATSVLIQLLPSAGDIQEKIKLELQYRSGGGNSWAGKGWELEPGYIAKINKFGADNANNPYLLALNGVRQELVSIGSNQYRTKIESYLKIEFNGSIWQVWDKDGTLYKFDASSGGRWLLARVTNTHGISAVLEYDKPSNEENYLREIRYPEGSGLSSYCKVSFTSEDRPDKFSTYYYGSVCKVNRRLKEIHIMADGRDQKKYILDYAANGSTNISLLSSVTEYGKDGAALPPTTFIYQRPMSGNFFNSRQQWLGDNAYYTRAAGFTNDIGFIIPSGIDMAVIDLDNDNLPDLIGCEFIDSVPANISRSKWIVYRNTGNGFGGQEAWAELNHSWPSAGGLSTVHAQAITLTRGATLIDMNKDGLPDLVYSKYAASTGHMGISQPVYDIFVRYNTGQRFSDNEVKLLDNNKAYFTWESLFYALEIGISANLADLNADGLPDLIYHKPREWISWGPNIRYAATDWTVRLNTGNGFSDEEKTWLSSDKAYMKYTLANFGGGREYVFEGINLFNNGVLADMNQDGLLDLVYSDNSGENYIGNMGGIVVSAPIYDIKVRFNTGSKFSDEAVTYYDHAPVYSYQVSGGSSARYAAMSAKAGGVNGTIADINADGLPDFIFSSYRTGPDDPGHPGSYCPNTHWEASLNSGNKFKEPTDISGDDNYFLNNDRLYANVFSCNSYFIDMNKDGVADLVYPRFTDWQFGKEKFSVNVWINQGAASTDLLTCRTSPFGGKTEIKYASSGNFNNNGSDDKNDLPFVMPVAVSVTKNPGIGSPGTVGYSYDGGSYDLLNRVFRGFRHTQVTDELGNVGHTYYHQDDSRIGKIERQENAIIRVLNTYKDDNSAPYWTPLMRSDEYTGSKCKRTDYEYDDYGNVIKTLYYGDSDVSGDEKSVFTEYNPNASAWLLNLPSRERVFSGLSGAGIPAAETQYFYDNNSNYSNVPVKGDLTAIKRYLNTKNNYIQTTSAYDAYGNEVSKTDGNGNTTKADFDPSYHAFPVLLTNALGQPEKTFYYMSSDAKGLFGQVKSKIDPNKNETIFEYDGFGRKTKISGPYDLYSTYGSESYEYGMGGPGSNYILTRTTEVSGTANHLIKIDILDGLERVIQNGREGKDALIYSYVTTVYNPRGEISKASLPYFKDGGLRTAYHSAEGLCGWTQYVYDAIGRITSITKPDSSTINNSYDGWSTTITDENGHQRALTKDAYGLLSQVKEKNGSEEYSTNYRYDCFDNFTQITDHLGNKFEFLYDTLRRRTKMVDPDLGTWSYDYDNNGNLVKFVNGAGQTVSFTYDALNRLTAKDYSTSTGVEVTYTYDEGASTNGIGRRTSMKDLSGASRWQYDLEGRAVKLEKTVGADNPYVVQWSYDAMDRIKSIIFPNLKEVKFTYNNAGLPESIDNFVLGTDYNASMQPAAVTFSNNFVTRYGYYPENQRLKSILTGSLQDLTYVYDKAGNIVKITDAAHSYTKDYAYDGLDRLVSGDGNTYEYNAIGNIIKTNGAVQSYHASKIHALTNDGKNSYAYDACGNMTFGAGRTIIYDPENRPTSITKDGIKTQFIYDGDGKRVKKIVTSGSSVTSTVYIEDLYEKETNN